MAGRPLCAALPFFCFLAAAAAGIDKLGLRERVAPNWAVPLFFLAWPLTFALGVTFFLFAAPDFVLLLVVADAFCLDRVVLEAETVLARPR